ncbi:hypothetical protein B8V81_3592 [Paenibacillus pasadenensis]|uniref:Uncharacterized protein n=1 Tax=Paenibacillus pasadenensis TaxID=217090 RepID=A0A2N5N4A6_9BACL|nr:hypothetical protein B8V81_3592 [Paenibacillus pasadenensis]
MPSGSAADAELYYTDKCRPDGMRNMRGGIDQIVKKPAADGAARAGRR